MKITSLAVASLLWSTVALAQGPSTGVAARVEQLSKDVEKLKQNPGQATQNPGQTAAVSPASGAPLEVRTGQTTIVKVGSDPHGHGLVETRSSRGGTTSQTGMSPNGKGGGSWYISPEGKTFANIVPNDKGIGELDISSDQERRLTDVTGDEDGGAVHLWSSGKDSAGNYGYAVNLYVWNDGGGNVSIFNKEHKRVANLGVGSNHTEGGLYLYDRTGGKALANISTTTDGASGSIDLLGETPQFQLNGKVHDYAEVFDIADRGGMRPGSVVVESGDGHGLILASGAYNPAVVGVIAGAGDFRSGIVMGNRSDGTTDLPVATGGQVFVRVSAEAGPISVGDLLVSSGTAGVAMRGGDIKRLTGTVIGKALQPYAGEEEGLIRMLVLNR